MNILTTAPTSPSRRRPRVTLILLLITWLPALPFAVGIALTSLTGCTVNEAGTRPCPVDGHDIGDLLYALTMTGWLLIPLLPFMALTLLLTVLQGLLMVVEAWRRRRRASRGRR
ncbi:hypothetical protein MRF4_09095 [Methylobacterium radiotolerans]|uniref:hypothetical protein n=1 Tax=Methylobacterium TaxID=407 RepID=UPI002F33817F